MAGTIICLIVGFSLAGRIVWAMISESFSGKNNFWKKQASDQDVTYKYKAKLGLTWEIRWNMTGSYELRHKCLYPIPDEYCFCNHYPMFRARKRMKRIIKANDLAMKMS
jgi:hypothetical protein